MRLLIAGFLVQVQTGEHEKPQVSGLQRLVGVPVGSRTAATSAATSRSGLWHASGSSSERGVALGPQRAGHRGERPQTGATRSGAMSRRRTSGEGGLYRRADGMWAASHWPVPASADYSALYTAAAPVGP